MPSLTIRHVTTYRYRQPVTFGEHRLMLRPRDSHDQRVIEATLGITPEPSTLRFVRDGFGNHVAIAEFDGRASELRFDSLVSLERSPAGDLDAEPAADGFAVDYIERQHADPHDEVGRWARQFLHAGDSVGTLELLIRLSQGIHQGFLYRRREAKGIQQPLETLRLGHGSCRDFAVLMIEAARSLGLAARFVSGYLAVPLGPDEELGGAKAVDQAHGATHAWAQVYLPGAGWIDVDPTSGNVGRAALVTVAVVRDPIEALPLHGTFIGSATDPLGMDVHVSITSVAPQQ